MSVQYNLFLALSTAKSPGDAALKSVNLYAPAIVARTMDLFSGFSLVKNISLKRVKLIRITLLEVYVETNSDCRLPDPLNVLLEKLLSQCGSRVLSCRSKTSAPTVPQSDIRINYKNRPTGAAFFFLSKIFGGPGILNLAKEILSVIDVYEINHIRHLISNPSTKRLNLICVSDHKRLEIFGNVNNRAVTTLFRTCQMKSFYSYQRHSL